MSESDIIKGCQNNLPSAQEALFNTFSNKMFAVCYRYTDDKTEAEDILQDGFIKVFKKIKLFKKEGSFEGWIKRIMINTALDHFRKNKKHKFIDLSEEANQNHVLTESNNNLETKDLLKIIQSLPKGFKTVFNLYAIEGYSHKEIGQMLGISESTSKSQYNRARVKLMGILNSI